MLAGSGSIIAGRGSTVAVRGSRFTVRGWRFAVRGSRFRRSGAGPMSIDAGCGECRVELTPGVVVRTNACVRSRLWRAFVHAGCGHCADMLPRRAMLVVTSHRMGIRERRGQGPM